MKHPSGFSPSGSAKSNFRVLFVAAIIAGTMGPAGTFQSGAQGPASRTPYGAFTGRVLALDGTPIPGVRVSAVLPQGNEIVSTDNALVIAAATSDESGRYRLDNLPPDRYHIVAARSVYPGGNAEPIRIDAVAGAVRDGLDLMLGSGFTVRGSLAVRPALPQSRVMIQLWADSRIDPDRRNAPAPYGAADLPGTRMIMETSVRPDLTFEFRNVPPGAHAITTNVPLRSREGFVLTVDRDITDLQLGADAPGVRVIGRVVGIEAPRPIPALDAILYANGAMYRTVVNSDGTFEFLRASLDPAQPGSNPATVLIVSSHGPMEVPVRGATPWGMASLPVGPGDRTGIEVSVPFGAPVSGGVSSEDVNGRVTSGLPPGAQPASFPVARAPGFFVNFLADPNNAMYIQAVDQDGRIAGWSTAPFGRAFGLSLREGEYRLSVRNVPEGYSVASLSLLSGNLDLKAEALRIAPDRTAQPILIRLRQDGSRKGAIAGRILYTDGTPAVGIGAGALEPLSWGVKRADSTLILTGARTDGEGRYRLDGLSPGPYYVVVGSVVSTGGGQVTPERGQYLSNPTYFPGGANRELPLIVRSGETLNTEFRLQDPAPGRKPSFRVTGHVNLNTGANSAQPSPGYFGPSRGSVVLVAGQGANCPFRAVILQSQLSGAIGPDGAYAIRNVPPGTYSACIPMGGDVIRGSWGNIPVTVVDRDVANIDISRNNFSPNPPRG